MPLVGFLQRTMARFDLSGALSITWADTCSTLRAGESVVITKTEQHWMTTGKWVGETIRALFPD